LRLACVGVLEPRKNQRFLLEVIKGVEAEQAVLHLYGTGPDEQFLQEIVQRENLTDRVLFEGWVPSEEIWPDIDLLLMPSLHEGAPNAVLEAIGHGVPVLASDIAEHREILPEKALLSLDKFTEWAKEVELVFHNPEIQLQNIVREQEVSAQQMMFDWERLITEIIIYR